MKISDVRIRLIAKEEGKLRAVASVTFDECFVVHDIKVIDSPEGAFIAMPSRKTNDGEYKDDDYYLYRLLNEREKVLIKVYNSLITGNDEYIQEI